MNKQSTGLRVNRDKPSLRDSSGGAWHMQNGQLRGLGGSGWQGSARW